MRYAETTAGITVEVEPTFLDEQSSPGDGHYVWAYSVRIANNSTEGVQLLSRHWRITDALGRTQEVRGPGVVGEQPHIAPGEAFEYASGAPLGTASGMMVGSYELATDGGRRLEVAIPAFSLDSPHQPLVVH
ncbi:ApaG protein [Tistlia consotensis]|uniref:Protein ApaG n=1 Tax=Tistlia consotensis USBA 355 TaxID=560819 RepID=A0A1Y6BGT7_9PROT|nr:Co2+/Mg2+ efflux protein ApaG [Tistlia consotensis]SMF06986.1 ApaG protein [Tistlia consotensis USBA 355]SNR36158.1 ApaG protein [Tistlia consotensis]